MRRMKAAYDYAGTIFGNIGGGCHAIPEDKISVIIKKMDVCRGEVCWEIGCGIPHFAFVLSAATLQSVLCTDVGTVYKTVLSTLQCWNERVSEEEKQAYAQLPEYTDAELEQMALSSKVLQRSTFLEKHFHLQSHCGDMEDAYPVRPRITRTNTRKPDKSTGTSKKRRLNANSPDESESPCSSESDDAVDDSDASQQSSSESSSSDSDDNETTSEGENQ